MKKAETQEQEFLEVCSSYDHDLLTGKKEMTLKDYERITYLVSSLGYSQYLQFLIGKYMDLAQADEEREEREHEIYLEYPEYYEVSAKYCYITHELRLHQNDRCKRFTPV